MKLVVRARVSHDAAVTRGEATPDVWPAPACTEPLTPVSSRAARRIVTGIDCLGRVVCQARHRERQQGRPVTGTKAGSYDDQTAPQPFREVVADRTTAGLRVQPHQM